MKVARRGIRSFPQSRAPDVPSRFSTTCSKVTFLKRSEPAIDRQSVRRREKKSGQAGRHPPNDRDSDLERTDLKREKGHGEAKRTAACFRHLMALQSSTCSLPLSIDSHPVCRPAALKNERSQFLVRTCQARARQPISLDPHHSLRESAEGRETCQGEIGGFEHKMASYGPSCDSLVGATISRASLFFFFVRGDPCSPASISTKEIRPPRLFIPLFHSCPEGFNTSYSNVQNDFSRGPPPPESGYGVPRWLPILSSATRSHREVVIRWADLVDPSLEEFLSRATLHDPTHLPTRPLHDRQRNRHT